MRNLLFLVLLVSLAACTASHADNSSPVPPAPPPVAAPPATQVADPEPAKTEVPKLDTLHQYAVDAVLTLTPPYAETVPGVHFESPELRKARWTIFANDCADAVQASGVKEQVEYTLTCIWVAHRETILARDPCHIGIGNCDDGVAGDSPWQIHAEGEYKDMDRMKATTMIAMLRKSPSAWGLPGGGKPWLGLVADRGKHGVNRPSVMEYLRAHPFTP